MKTTAKLFQKKVLCWFDQHGRHDLPWQQNKTAYRVWVSEIMLQQTQVNTVIPFYQRFMQRFPNIQSLAQATEDEVLHHWTGLGYYSRARNLQRSAKKILEKYHNIFPAKQSQLESLPGIGRSTAGAILAIAFNKQSAILDGNVKRVLTRLFAITAWPGEKKVAEQLWKIAEKYTPSERVADYTQAMMDLGATICTRGKPHCEKCPLEKICHARQLGIEKTLPQTKPKKTLPIKSATLLILQKDQHILLQKRPPTGIWGGLWSLPEIQQTASAGDIAIMCAKQFGITASITHHGEIFRHTFSHFHLDILPMYLLVKKMQNKVMEDTGQIWYNLQQPAAVGLPAPIKSLLSKLL